MVLRLFALFIILFSGTINCTKHQLVVYWGQDSAGSLRLKLETKLSEFCLDYDYDIIPIAFLNVFFDTANKGICVAITNNLKHIRCEIIC